MSLPVYIQHTINILTASSSKATKNRTDRCSFRIQQAIVKIRPRKCCYDPHLISLGWGSYDKVVVFYSGKLGNTSEARASDLTSYPGLWWNRIKLRLYAGKESEYSPRTCSIGRPAGGTLCPHPITLQIASSVQGTDPAEPTGPTAPVSTSSGSSEPQTMPPFSNPISTRRRRRLATAAGEAPPAVDGGFGLGGGPRPSSRRVATMP